MKPNKRNFTYTVKKTASRVKAFLINKKSPSFYAEQSRRLLESGNEKQAKNMLHKGVSFYPNSLLIHREYALYHMGKEKWKKATQHWDKVFASPNKHLLEEKDFKKASIAYLRVKSIEQSIKVLRDGYSRYENDLDLAMALAENLMKANKWEEATQIYMSLLAEKDNAVSDDVYVNLMQAYEYLGKDVQADYIMREAVSRDPENRRMMEYYSKLAIKRKEWKMAIQRYEYLLTLYGETVPGEPLLILAMLHQMIGEHEQANDYMALIDQEKTDNNESYEKIRLFENEGSTIDFYKKYNQNNQVIISFDSRDMDWNEQPFGFKLLLRQNIDIIAVRQKEKRTYQQSLSQDEFIDTLRDLVEGYEDKIAYGHSLGGYTSLYYASNLDCRILSLAPRISVHPLYGSSSIIKKHVFEHHLEHNFNDRIKPIIVYDPKNKMDNTYVKEALLTAYPNAETIELTYGGHGIARHLLRMGVLKDFILAVIDGEMPKYNRKLKGNSANYCRLLGRECLKRKKLNWAVSLADKSFALLPDDRYVVKFKLDVIKTTEGHEAALEFIKNKVIKYPRKLSFRIILIEHYVEMEDLIHAEIELNRALKDFKSKGELLDWKGKIESVRQRIVAVPPAFLRE